MNWIEELEKVQIPEISDEFLKVHPSLSTEDIRLIKGIVRNVLEKDIEDKQKENVLKFFSDVCQYPQIYGMCKNCFKVDSKFRMRKRNKALLMMSEFDRHREDTKKPEDKVIFLCNKCSDDIDKIKKADYMNWFRSKDCLLFYHSMARKEEIFITLMKEVSSDDTEKGKNAQRFLRWFLDSLNTHAERDYPRAVIRFSAFCRSVRGHLRSQNEFIHDGLLENLSDRSMLLAESEGMSALGEEAKTTEKMIEENIKNGFDSIKKLSQKMKLDADTIRKYTRLLKEKDMKVRKIGNEEFFYFT